MPFSTAMARFCVAKNVVALICLRDWANADGNIAAFLGNSLRREGGKMKVL